MSHASGDHTNEKPYLGTSAGAPIGNKFNSMTIGPRGPILLQDNVFIDEMAHFDRERIPERVVHAKGAGAFGYFQCTNDVTMYTKVAPFSEIGKKTDLFVRFSTVGLESGSADTVRDPRGFAVKFYTELGNWDIVGNNTPMFFIRDPIFFPSLIHTQKRNPRTHLKDHNARWDFLSLRPESAHQTCFVNSDRGIPDGHRHMNGYGSHTFKLVNSKDEAFYCKFIFKTNQGIKNLPCEKADEIAGRDADYSIRDLYYAIEEKNFPSWTLNLQVMTYEQAEKCPFNPFDVTKTWPRGEYPLIPVGQMVLDRNPRNYFSEVEQSAFSPASMIPGVEPSPDKMLQGRLFSYGDTHRHRLGPNFNLIPVNKPRCPFKNYQVDGLMRCDDNNGDLPHYYPNSYGGPEHDPKHLEHREFVNADIFRHDSGNEDNYSQPTIFYTKVLDKDAKLRLACSLAGSICHASEPIRARTIKHFMNVHKDLGEDIIKCMEKNGVKTCLNCQL